MVKVPRATRVEVHTWFERDRACVEVRNSDSQETIFELWDDDCMQAFADGFLEAGNVVRSALAYAEHLGALKVPYLLVEV